MSVQSPARTAHHEVPEDQSPAAQPAGIPPQGSPADPGANRLGLLASVAGLVGLLVVALAVYPKVVDTGTDPVAAQPHKVVGVDPVSPHLPGLVWSDEFSGGTNLGPDLGRWSPALGAGWGNNELQAYTDRIENLAQDGSGNLRITAMAEPYVDGKGRQANYTSARIQSVDPVSFSRVEARMLVPRGQGLWSAFWTLGADHPEVGWPKSGEIDVMELLNDTTTLHGNLHAHSDGAGPVDPTDGSEAPLADGWQRIGQRKNPEGYAGAWHVYAVERKPGELRFLVDGQLYHTVRRADRRAGEEWPFDQPQRLLLNLAVGGEWPGPPNATTSFPAQVQVDYVRAFGNADSDN